MAARHRFSYLADDPLTVDDVARRIRREQRLVAESRDVDGVEHHAPTGRRIRVHGDGSPPIAVFSGDLLPTDAPAAHAPRAAGCAAAGAASLSPAPAAASTTRYTVAWPV